MGKPNEVYRPSDHNLIDLKLPHNFVWFVCDLAIGGKINVLGMMILAPQNHAYL